MTKVTLWQLLTLTVGVNSFGLTCMELATERLFMAFIDSESVHGNSHFVAIIDTDSRCQ